MDLPSCSNISGCVWFSVANDENASGFVLLRKTGGGVEEVNPRSVALAMHDSTVEMLPLEEFLHI